MELTSKDIVNNQPIDPKFAFGKPADNAPMVFSSNLNPHLHWSGVPAGTKSFVILCMDPDVPSVADDVNQAGKVIPNELPRVAFCHWAMVDIPVSIHEIHTGECSDEVTPKGKQHPKGPPGSRQGLNDYTQFMAGDPSLSGQYYGYDGPCPPWNDERLHHYIFTVYAVCVDHLDLPQPFTGHDVQQALDGLILDQASLTGTYTLFKR